MDNIEFGRRGRFCLFTLHAFTFFAFHSFTTYPSRVTCHRIYGLSILQIVGRTLSFASMRVSTRQP